MASSCSRSRTPIVIIGATTGAVIGSVLDDGGTGGKIAGALIGGAAANLLVDNPYGSQKIQPKISTQSQSFSNGNTNCRKVTTKIWDGNKLVSSKTEEVCRGDKSTPTY